MSQKISARAVTAGPARAWRTRRNRYGLVGSHCRICQSCSFPPLRRCPRCVDAVQEEAIFSGRGTVICLAEDHSPLVGHGDRAPRPFAMVRLDEGPVLMAEIVDADYEGLAPEQPVEMVIRKWRPEQSGLALYGFKFRVAS